MAFPKGHKLTPRTRYPSEFKQARDMEQLSHSLALELKQSLKEVKSQAGRCRIARALRDVVHSWDTARDAMRILKGKGLPVNVPGKTKPRKLGLSSYQILDLEDVPTKALPAPAESNGPETGDRPGEKGIS